MIQSPCPPHPRPSAEPPARPASAPAWPPRNRFRFWPVPAARTSGQPVPGLSRARRMRRCGRAALLWVLALYAIAQATLFVVMDRWHPMRVNAWRDKFVQLRQMVEREPERPLLVMLGSSRTDAAFQAGQLNDLPGPDGRPFLAYNFGTPAGGPIHQLLFL